MGHQLDNPNTASESAGTDSVREMRFTGMLIGLPKKMPITDLDNPLTNFLTRDR
jgi:hypothetical protein